MNLADKQCYPVVIPVEPSRTWKFGLTFRERLIIALAGNPAITADIRSTNPNLPIGYWAEKNAKILGIQADAIIKEMDSEE